MPLCSSRPLSPRRVPRAGFTLIEILIVLALMASIATLVVINADTVLGSNKEKVAKSWVENTAKLPLVSYMTDMNSYPTTAQGLEALVAQPAGAEGRWKGPYMDKLPDDPWGEPYQYRYPGKHNPNKYDVWSLGPDRKPDSGDEIGNWE